MKSRCSSLNTFQDLLLAPDASIRNLSCKTFRVIGDTLPFGITPALNASKRPEPTSFMKYSAKMLLLAFQVQRNSILNFCAGVSIGKQAKSLASVANRYRPVARILAGIRPPFDINFVVIVSAGVGQDC